jgi:hypothetical protein
MLSMAPVFNKGYYDVPICNEYSNKEIRDRSLPINEYELNKIINLTINDNKDSYVVYQDPTVPSPSLYLETDQAMSGYYHKNPMNLAFDGAVPIGTKKESKVYNYINSDIYPPFGIESFDNQNSNRKGGVFLLLLIIIIIAFYFFSN